MKKMLFLLGATLLTACQNVSEPQAQQQALDTPQQTEQGFIRLSPKSQYYVDTSSIWVDNEVPHLINFDIVINLHIGHRVFADGLLSRSIRQHKMVNCKNQAIIHHNSHLYSDFWGQGEALLPKHQHEHQVHPRPNSTYGVMAKLMCVNFYHQ